LESRLINLDYQVCDIEYNEFYLKDHLGNTRIRFADKDGDKKFTLAKNDNCFNEVFGSNHYPSTGDENLVGSYGPSGEVGELEGDLAQAARLNSVFKNQNPKPEYFIWRYKVRTPYNQKGKIDK